MRFTQLMKRAVPASFRPALRRYFDLLASKSPYRSRMRREIEHYDSIEHVHDLPPIADYWLKTHLIPMLQPFGFTSSIEMFRTHIAGLCRESPGEQVRVASAGSGDCATEINVAEWLREQGLLNFSFDCFDINEGALQRGSEAAARKGFEDRFSFQKLDINRWTPSRRYHVVLGIQSLHHFVELETLFDKIHKALRPDGVFLIDDMIGRNGHQRWPEALAIVNELWKELPDDYKYNHLLKRHEPEYDNWDCSREGFEGIRAQDILPLLLERFNFTLFIGFGNVIDIFIDRCFGPNFDPGKEWDRRFIDRVHSIDVEGIESGRLKPTHTLAAMTRTPVAAPAIYKHLSPRFCLRQPEQN